MSKKTPLNSVESSHIRQIVESEDDFGHEVRVGAAIRCVPASNWQHGGTYTDPILGKPRQFDYRCCLTKETQSLSLAVECKSLSGSVALAVCGMKRPDNEAFHDLIRSHSSNYRWSSATLRAKREDAFYLPVEFVGKNLVLINKDRKRSPDKDIYEGWSQALSSAVDLVKLACRSAEDTSVSESFTGILPVVVVPNYRLWKVVYDDNGSISADPSQEDACNLYVGNDIEVGPPESPHTFIFSHVHFFTLAGFGAFLSRMAINDHAWSKLFSNKGVEVRTPLSGV